ncbi:MAG: 3-dehydroquinate synthase, partial [Ginsengibacter sp.]
MDYIAQKFSVAFDYKVFFTTALFDLSNTMLEDFFKEKNTTPAQKIFFVIDSNVANTHPTLVGEIKNYFKKYPRITLIEEILITPGGEVAKNDASLFDNIVEAINIFKIDRHSFIA